MALSPQSPDTRVSKARRKPAGPYLAGILLVLSLIAAGGVLSAQEEGVEGDDGELWLDLGSAEGITVAAAPLSAQGGRELSREEIEESGALTLSDLLEKETGVTVLSNGGFGTVSSLSLGGFSGSRVGISLDGVPLNSPLSGGFDPGDLSLGAVEEIRIREGSPSLGDPADSSAALGAGLPGGNLSITTAGPLKRGFRSSASLEFLSYLSSRFPDPLFVSPGDLMRATLSAERGGERADWKVGGSLAGAANRYPWTDDEGTGRIREKLPVLEGGTHASVFLRPVPTAALALSALFHGADRQVPGPADTTTLSGRQRDSLEVESLRFEALRLGSDRLSGGITLGHAGTGLSWDGNGESSDHRSDTFSSSLTLQWYTAPEFSLAFGSSARLDRVRSSNAGNREALGGGMSLGSEWKPRSDISLSPSLSLLSDGKRLVPIPSLSAAWRMTGTTLWRSDLRRAFRFPSLNDLYWSGTPGASGNPDLKSEDGWVASLGLEKALGELSLSAALRGSHYRDAILWAGSETGLRPENLGEAWYLGTEETLEWKPRKGITLEFRHQWLFTRLLSRGLAWSDGKVMPYQAPQRLSFAAAFPAFGGSGTLRGTYEGLRFADSSNVSALSPWFTLDLSLRVPLSERARLSVSLNNALGESYELVEGYPMPGTSVSVLLDWRLLANPHR